MEAELELELYNEILDDVEIYEDVPDYEAPQYAENGYQDDELAVFGPVGFLARVSSVRTWQETLEWYATHTTKEQIGFDPDDMCLKVCRTARNIEAKHLTAKEAQDSTPEEFRVRSIAELRRGMVVYFDDPNDSNRAGHIVTLEGRRRHVDPNTLASLLVKTNTVLRDRLCTVAGDFFGKHWGDEFQFGATYLNGVEFDVPGRISKIERFNTGGPVYNLNMLNTAAKNGRERAGQILDRIEHQIKRLPDSPKLPRVREFKDEWRDTRKIDMDLLDASVKAGRTGLIQQVRDEIKRLIEALPDE